MTARLRRRRAFPELPGLAERGLADGVGGLYQQMADRGELFHGRPAGFGHSGAVARVPWTVGAGRWRLPATAGAWRNWSSILRPSQFPLAELVERGQGFKDGGQDVRDFRAAVLGDHVRPSQSLLLLRAAMSAARVTGDPSGNWKLAKHVQGGRRANARGRCLRCRDCSCGGAGYRRWTAKTQATTLALQRDGGLSWNQLQMRARRRAQVRWRVFERNGWQRRAHDGRISIRR